MPSQSMHKHHVTPSYRDPDSTITVEVSVTCHAMFHWCEWQLHGDKRDWLAWKGLRGEIPKEEIIRQLRQLGGRKAREKLKGVFTDKMLEAAKQSQPLAVEAARSPESIAKRKKTFADIGHQQGEKNSQFGKPKSEESNRQRGLKLQPYSTIVVSTPEGVKTLTGWKNDMAEQLGISVASFDVLRRKGKLKSLGLKLESIT